MQTHFNFPVIVDVVLAENLSNNGLFIKRGGNFSCNWLDYIKFSSYSTLAVSKPSKSVDNYLPEVFVNYSLLCINQVIKQLFHGDQGLQSKRLSLGVGNDNLNYCPRPSALGNSSDVIPSTSGQQF